MSTLFYALYGLAMLGGVSYSVIEGIAASAAIFGVGIGIALAAIERERRRR